MLRQASSLLLSCRWGLAAQQSTFATAAAAALRHTTGDVPAGHVNSDLSSWACHIGLGRRRDLTLRQDLCLWKDGAKVSLADVLKGRRVILVGFPGGPICTEKHIPGYVQAAEALASRGVDKVVAVTVDEPGAVQELAKLKNLQSTRVELLADRNGGFTRLLGLELAPPEAGKEAGPKCQRYAGVVEDGILLKLCVEKAAGQLQVSTVDKMLAIWEDIYPEKPAK